MTATAAPSITVIMLDDVPDDLCRLGMTRVCERLPSGRVYANSFTNFSLCAPSRATFLTGQEAATHGVVGDEQDLAGHEGLLPRQLELAGYTTGVFGKHPNAVPFGMGRIGFTDWAVLDDRDDRYFDPVWRTPAGKVGEQGYTPDLAYRRCLDFATGSGPRFSWCAAIGAHAPKDPRPDMIGTCSGLAFPHAASPAFNEADLSDKPAWFDPKALNAGKQAKMARNWRTTCEVLAVDDRWIAEFIDRAGPDHIVILTADNGFGYGLQRMTGKVLPFDWSIRVPLVVWGGTFEPGVDSRLVSNVDLPVTILALAGAEPGRPVDPDARDLRGARRESVRIMSRWGENEIAPGPSGMTVGLVEQGWRYWEHLPDGGEELYDMAADPAQVQSLAARPDQRKRKLRMRRLARGE